VSGTVTVAMSESNGTGTISWTLQLDGGATPIFSTSNTGPTASFAWNTSGVAPGPHTLTLTVQDGGGRTATATRNVTVTTAPPLTAPFTSPAEGATVSGPITVSVSESNGTGTISWTVRLDGGSTPIFSTSNTGPTASFTWDTSSVAPGSHTLNLTVQDGGGRTATATRTVTVQSVGTIKVFITQPAEGATVTGTVWFTTWLENAAAGSRTLTLSIDGVAVATTSTTSNGPISMTWNSTAASGGTHTATVSVRDSVNNTGSANRTVVVPGAAQLEAFFTSPAEGASVFGTVTVGMGERNANGTPILFVLTVDGAEVFRTSGTATTASFNWNSNSVANGPHQLGLTVQDGAGRTATAVRNVTVQQSTIKVFITQPTEGATVSGSVWFTIWIENAAAGTKTFTMTVNGSVVGTSTSTSNGPVSMPWASTGVPNGPRQVTITVRDTAGGTGSAVRTVNVAN
jgi:hypothetical protein